MCKPCLITAIIFLTVVIGGFLYLWNEAQAAGEIIINEIAWMGRVDASGSSLANDEWIELRNTTNSSIDLTNWKLIAQDGTPEINLEGTISANGYFLLERTDDNSVPSITMDQKYTGALGNGGEYLELFDANENLIDSINASGGWLGGDNLTKATMERTENGTWQTGPVGGTPKAQNSSATAEPEPEPEPEPPAPPPPPEPEPPTQEPEPEPVTTEKETPLELTDSQTDTASNETSNEKPNELEFIKTNDIIISEFMPNPEGSDSENEWIELYNKGSEIYDISNWLLDDMEGGSKPFVLPESTTILPDEYRVFSIKLTKIALTNSGDTVRLIYPDNSIANEAEYTQKADEGISYALIAGKWVWTDNATPGYENKNPTPPKQTVSSGQKTTKSTKTPSPLPAKDEGLAENKTLSAEEFSAQIATDSTSPKAFAPFIVGILIAIAGGAGFLFLRRKMNIL